MSRPTVKLVEKDFNFFWNIYAVKLRLIYY